MLQPLVLMKHFLAMNGFNKVKLFQHLNKMNFELISSVGIINQTSE